MSGDNGQRPTIQFVLLTLLARRPSTGRELAARLADPVGFFWSAPHSQIYPQLARLVEDGLVTFDIESAGTVRPRKRYRPTRAGRATLVAWLLSTPERSSPKNELMVRAYAVSQVDPARAAPMYRAVAAEAEARLTAYEQFEADLLAESPEAVDDPSHPDFGTWSVLQAGLLSERSTVRWCHWMADRLEGGGTRTPTS